jgi:hypothetical protein
MSKIDKFKANKSVINNTIPRSLSYESSDDSEFDDISYDSKKKVNCICPKCGEHHVMVFHWIGRGTPRKFCQTCKGGTGG